ncbi:MAG: hypothetical protein ABL901_11395 [Hyphomicrobiaceae bacterium]
MRFASVLGAIGVGLAIGSAAVLAPLTMGTPTSGSVGNATASETSSTVQWASQWGRQAIGAVRSLTGSTANSSATTAPTRPAAISAQTTVATTPGQDAKTIDDLAQPHASGTAKVADARIVQTPWATQVTVAPESALPKKLTSSKPSSDEQRQSLVRDLQAELKRVGCYDGEPNGQWGAASKRAMASFTERVNASLPFEQPDFILLTLVQGHKGRACGQECPAGQGMANTGRCMPNSILAQAERSNQAERSKQGDGRESIKRDTVAAAASVAAAAAVTAKSNDQPKSKPRVIQQNPASIASAWATTTLEAPLETGSLAASAAPAPVRITRPQQTASVAAGLTPAKPQTTMSDEAQTPTRPVAVLPGRMAIGAPLPAVTGASPAPAAGPVRPAATHIAAADIALPAAPPTSEPVTATNAEVAPAPRARRVVRSQPIARVQPALPHAPAAPHVVKRSEPVTVHRPRPVPRYYAQPQYAGNNYGTNTSGSKSRRMVYEMFQRPDRN